MDVRHVHATPHDRDATRRPGRRRRAEMPPPHIRIAANTLCSFSKPTSPCSSSSLREVSVEAANSHQISPPNASVVMPASAITVMPAATMVRHCAPASSANGDQQGELRLVGEQAEQNAGRRSDVVGNVSSAAPSKSAVRNPFWPWPRLMNTAGKAAAIGSQSRAIDGVIAPRSRAGSRRSRPGTARSLVLPDDQRQRIGHQRQRRRTAERSADTASRNRAWPCRTSVFAGEVRGHVVDVARRGLRPSSTGGIGAGEVGADRLAVAIDQPVREQDQRSSTAENRSRIRL